MLSKFSGSKKIWIDERGRYHVFPSKLLCLTVPLKYHGELRRCFKMFRRHFSCIGGIRVQWVLSRTFCLTAPIRKASFTVPSVFQKTSVMENKNWATERGVNHELPSKFLSPSTEKFLEDPSWFQKTCGFEKVYGWEGDIGSFRWSFFVSLYQEFSIGTLLWFKKLLLAKILYVWEKGL